MRLRIEPNARSKSKATAWDGPLMAATFFKDSKDTPARANVVTLGTSADLRAIADALDAWEASR